MKSNPARVNNPENMIEDVIYESGRILNARILQTLAVRRTSNEEEQVRDFVDCCVSRRMQLASILAILSEEANDGELAAFASYAMAFPDSFTALVDTYEVLR